MKRRVVKFNNQDQPEFYKELRKRVNSHFKDNNISKYANTSMKIKTVFMLLLYFTPMVVMYTGMVQGVLPVLSMWILMGFGMSGIGLSIMHDANHGSYSKKKWVNSSLGFLINFLGAYDINWKIQHNTLHHSFTNIDDFDGDIENPVMRFSPNQERKGIFRFQAFYAPFFYGIMTLYWFLVKDYIRLNAYKKESLLSSENISYGKALAMLTFNKIWYIGLTIVLPFILVDLPWYYIITGFFLMHFICGLMLALIFQPAHVIEETSFYEVDTNSSVENNWAIHQMRTTSNYSNGSVVFSWLVGGLNNQIEHHLFPNICHVHYNDISKIVKATAKDYNIPYHQHTTFYDALKSHFTLLNKLGTGSYDKEHALA